MTAEPEYDLRQGCVLGIALCSMIIEHNLWPDIDDDSLEEFKESVESMHHYCLEAVRQHDAESDSLPDEA